MVGRDDWCLGLQPQSKYMVCLCVFVCVLSSRCLVCRPSHLCVCRDPLCPISWKAAALEAVLHRHVRGRRVAHRRVRRPVFAAQRNRRRSPALQSQDKFIAIQRQKRGTLSAVRNKTPRSGEGKFEVVVLSDGSWRDEQLATRVVSWAGIGAMLPRPCRAARGLRDGTGGCAAGLRWVWS